MLSDLLLLAARVLAGLFLVARGLQHAGLLLRIERLTLEEPSPRALSPRRPSPPPTEDPSGHRTAVAVSVAEVIAGLLLLTGLALPAAAGVVVAAALHAMVWGYWQHDVVLEGRSLEYPVVAVAGALVLAFTGPGTLSLDTIAGWRAHGVEWGVAAIAGGFAAGFLAVGSRDPGMLVDVIEPVEVAGDDDDELWRRAA